MTSKNKSIYFELLDNYGLVFGPIIVSIAREKLEHKVQSVFKNPFEDIRSTVFRKRVTYRVLRKSFNRIPKIIVSLLFSLSTRFRKYDICLLFIRALVDHIVESGDSRFIKLRY